MKKIDITKINTPEQAEVALRDMFEDIISSEKKAHKLAYGKEPSDAQIKKGIKKFLESAEEED